MVRGHLRVHSRMAAMSKDRLTALEASSQLRAFENDIGVQPPVGFWDPCGLSRDGDVSNYVRRRTVELKHSRVCMVAAIGYMMPEYYKWPGYCSQSSKLLFTDIPNGLAAIQKIPAAG